MWNQCNLSEWTQVGTQYSKHSLQELEKRHEVFYDAIATCDAERAIRDSRQHIMKLIMELDSEQS